MPRASEGSVYKPGDRKTWTIKFKNCAGNWQRIGGFKTIGAARSALERHKEEVRKRTELARLGISSEHDTNEIPIKGLFFEFLTSLRADKKVENYVKDVARNLGEILKITKANSISQLSTDTIHKALAKYGEKRSNTSRNKVRGFLYHFFEWLIKQDRWDKNPVKAIARLQPVDRIKKRTLSQEDLKKFFEASPRKRRLVYEFVANTGIRRGAAFGLLWEDIDIKNKIMKVRVLRNKTRKELTIPLNEVALRILAEQKPRKNVRKKAKVFNQGIPDKDTMKKDIKEAGLDFETADGIFSFHSLRKQLATDIIKSGQNPKIAQELLGHSSLKMTMGVYTDIDDKAKRRALKEMNKMRERESKSDEESPDKKPTDG